MKRYDAGCIGLRIDQAAICLEDAGSILIELADNAMYSGQEEVQVPNEVIRAIRDCAMKLDTAIEELALRAN